MKSIAIALFAVTAVMAEEVVVNEAFPLGTRLPELRDKALSGTLVVLPDSAEGYIALVGLGFKREGDFNFLSKLGKEKSFLVRQFDDFAEWKGRPISSSRVRQAVREGRMEDVSALIGRSYRMAGTVIHGDGRGRAFGIPTANLALWTEQLMPASGVYATYAWLEGSRYPAATNIGVRPTVNGRSLIVESHLLDFEGDLYGQELTLDFESRIRDEKKFPGLDALIAQIRADIGLVKSRLQPSSS